MRILEPFEDHFWEFYDSLPNQVKKKVDYVLQMVITLDRIPKQFFKHLEDGIYEIRIKSSSDIYRIFCFFRRGKAGHPVECHSEKIREDTKKGIGTSKIIKIEVL